MNAKHFFVIGAQRSGTTYLYKALDAHPDICMGKPIQPEPKFFLKTDLGAYRYEDYLRSYFDQTACKLYGEKTTTYIESERAAQQISQWFPDAKLVLILRDPIDRAISNYNFSCNNGLENLPIERAFLEESSRREDYDHSKISASPYAYLQRGRYIDYIRMYERHFPREQMMILIHEEFVGRVEAMWRLYSWLDVTADTQMLDVTTVVNSSEKVETNLAQDLEDYLIDYFAPSVRELEQYLARSLMMWSRFQPKG